MLCVWNVCFDGGVKERESGLGYCLFPPPPKFEKEDDEEEEEGLSENLLCYKLCSKKEAANGSPLLSGFSDTQCEQGFFWRGGERRA